MFDLEEELKNSPASPGVYLMHNDRDEIIYGKGSQLKTGCASIFQSSRNKTAKIEQMVSHIAWFEYILTDSEVGSAGIGMQSDQGASPQIQYHVKG